jgi:hypothetical protein
MEEYFTKKDLIDEFKKHTSILLEAFNSRVDFIINQQKDMMKDIGDKE